MSKPRPYKKAVVIYYVPRRDYNGKRDIFFTTEEHRMKSVMAQENCNPKYLSTYGKVCTTTIHLAIRDEDFPEKETT